MVEILAHFMDFCSQEFLSLTKIQMCKGMWKYSKSVFEVYARKNYSGNGQISRNRDSDF